MEKAMNFSAFFLSSRSRRMRDKSVRKFKDKVRELTRRSHNLDARVIEKLNRVIRGTANYFGPPFATVVGKFQKLDSWTRMRLRAMKLKRKNYKDNYKLRCNYFACKLGLLTLGPWAIWLTKNYAFDKMPLLTHKEHKEHKKWFKRQFAASAKTPQTEV